MSSGNRRKAEREAYHDVPETCPKVDEALRHAEDAIKVQTGRLREALVDAIERAIDAEESVSELEAEAKDLRSRIADLEYEVAELQKVAATLPCARMAQYRRCLIW